MLFTNETKQNNAGGIFGRKGPPVIPDDGTYKGRLVCGEEEELQIILRLEKRVKGVKHHFGAVSADFFQDDTYFGSMRGWLGILPEEWEVSEVSSMVRGETEPHSGGLLELRPVSEKKLRVTLGFPGSLPVTLEGTLDFHSSSFREVRVRIAKTEDIPRLDPFGRKARQRFSGFDRDEVTIEAILANEGFDAKVEWLEKDILAVSQNSGAQFDHYWDEKELHDLMVNSFPAIGKPGEWLLNLMVLPGYFGGFQIDSQGKPVLDLPNLTGVMFDRKKGYQVNLGGGDSFFNDRPRQGAAIFWQALNQLEAQQGGGRLPNHYLYGVMHELGHLLNLEHPRDCPKNTFMSRPSGSRLTEGDPWSSFAYCYGDQERFHLRHGFYHEVMPGGRADFMATTSESFFQERESFCKTPELSLVVESTKPVFDFMEPVTVTLTLTNHSLDVVSVPYLSPSFGDTVFWIKKPDGNIVEYEPPIRKCAASRETLAPGESKSHLVSLIVNRAGFWLDSPGRYQVFARIDDLEKISFDGFASTNLLIKAPTSDNEAMVQDLFNHDVAMFIFLAGGEHLAKAKNTLLDLVYCHPKHPLTPQANLVLGLNELRGHKSLKPQTSSAPDIQAGIHFLCRALLSGRLPALTEKRLLATLQFHREHFPRQFPNKIKQRLFQVPGSGEKKLQDFLGEFSLNLKIATEDKETPNHLDVTLVLERRPVDPLSYLRYDLKANRNHFLNHGGRGRFFEAGGNFQAFVKLEKFGPGSGLEFEAKLSFESAGEGFAPRLEGIFSLPGSGGGNGGTIGTSGSDPNSNPGQSLQGLIEVGAKPTG